MSSTTIALLSGGLDSATAAALAREAGHRVIGLSFDYGRVGRLRPGVFGVAPAAAHRASAQADKEGAAAGMQTFPLQGMEGFHHRQVAHARWLMASLGDWGRRWLAAWIKPVNSGWGRPGRERNSGWYWQARK